MTSKETLPNTGIPPRFQNATLDDFVVVSEAMSDALAIAGKWPWPLDEAERCVPDDEISNNLWILGPTGTGKTLLACAVLNCNRDVDGASIAFVTPQGLLRELRATWSKGSSKTESEVLDHYADVECLLVDDVGTGFNSDADRAQLGELIDLRYVRHRRRTIITSNLTPTELRQALGDRAYSRLRDKAIVIVLDGPDHRQQLQL